MDHETMPPWVIVGDNAGMLMTVWGGNLDEAYNRKALNETAASRLRATVARGKRRLEVNNDREAS